MTSQLRDSPPCVTVHHGGSAPRIRARGRTHAAQTACCQIDGPEKLPLARRRVCIPLRVAPPPSHIRRSIKCPAANKNIGHFGEQLTASNEKRIKLSNAAFVDKRSLSPLFNLRSAGHRGPFHIYFHTSTQADFPPMRIEYAYNDERFVDRATCCSVILSGG